MEKFSVIVLFCFAVKGLRTTVILPVSSDSLVPMQEMFQGVFVKSMDFIT